MTHITLPLVRAAFDEILAEKGPDYVYVYEEADSEGLECSYAYSDGTPACAVGHIIAKLDPELFEQMKEAEEKVGPFGVTAMGNNSRIPAGDIDEDALEWMAFVQDAQDDEKTWGAAKQKSDDELTV